MSEKGLCLQIATKAGAANIPPWYDAGKVWIESHPGFPFGMQLPLSEALQVSEPRLNFDWYKLVYAQGRKHRWQKTWHKRCTALLE